MPGFLVLIFWLWTAASVLILLRRLLTTGSLRSGRKRAPSPPLAEPGAPDQFAEFEAKLATQKPPASAEAAAEPRSEADASVAPDRGARDMSRAETLAEALTGIEMPADLSPLVGDLVNPRHMLFATDTAAPETVGGALADELERLGFELQPLDDRSVAASRPDAAVEVRILPSAEAARAAIGAHIDSIPEHAVITEFHLR